WVTRVEAVEQRMSIDKGAGTNYAEDSRNYELAIVDVTNPDDQTAAVVPFKLLKAGGAIRDDKLPVDLDVVRAYENAGIVRRRAGDDTPADAGHGLAWRIEPKDPVSGIDPGE